MVEDLKLKNVGLDTQIKTVKNQLEEQVKEKIQVENRICALQSAHEQEKLQFEGTIKDLQSAKDSLIDSKLVLQSDLEDANARTHIIKQEIEKVKDASRKTEAKLQSELYHLETELVSVLCLISTAKEQKNNHNGILGKVYILIYLSQRNRNFIRS